MRVLEVLQGLCKEISTSKIEDSLGDLAQLSLFELQNLRTTASQHSTVNFLIEFRKANTGMIGVKDEKISEQIKSFYENSLKLNSPVDNEVIL